MTSLAALIMILIVMWILTAASVCAICRAAGIADDEAGRPRG